MSDTPLVLLERRESVAWLRLNRPGSRNALSLALVAELREHLEQLAKDSSVWVIGLVGEGAKAFCAGADLKERKEMDDTQAQSTVDGLRTLMNQVAALPQPTVALLNGAAFGGGLELALACDFRLASDAAVMGLTETQLAIIPGAGGCVRLPQVVGLAKAKELILLGSRLTAPEALEIGLVTQVLSSSNLQKEAEAFTDVLLQGGPLALQAAKKVLQSCLGLTEEEALALEMQQSRSLVPSKDRMEALQAFHEKRAPLFRGE